MTRRNIDPDEIKPQLLLSFEYPSPLEIDEMVRHAHQMRAVAIGRSFHWLWNLLARRRPDEAAAPKSALKA